MYDLQVQYLFLYKKKPIKTFKNVINRAQQHLMVADQFLQWEFKTGTGTGMHLHLLHFEFMKQPMWHIWKHTVEKSQTMERDAKGALCPEFMMGLGYNVWHWAEIWTHCINLSQMWQIWKHTLEKSQTMQWKGMQSAARNLWGKLGAMYNIGLKAEPIALHQSIVVRDKSIPAGFSSSSQCRGLGKPRRTKNTVFF